MSAKQDITARATGLGWSISATEYGDGLQLVNEYDTVTVFFTPAGMVRTASRGLNGRLRERATGKGRKAIVMRWLGAA